MGRASRKRKSEPSGRVRLGGTVARDPVVRRLVYAWDQLEEGAGHVVAMAAEVPDFGPYGTDELPAAVSALEAARTHLAGGGAEVALDKLDNGARWVSRAFTLTPGGAVQAGTGEAGLALVGAVLMLRGALMDLDMAKAAAA